MKWLPIIQTHPLPKGRASGLLWLVLLATMLITAGCVIGPRQADEPAPTPNPDSVPSLVIAPASGPPGTNIIVAGAGWQPREVVYVNLEVPPAPGAAAGTEIQRTTVVITTTTDIGQFVTNFVYPSDPAWRISTPIEITAYSFETKQRAAISYTVTALTPAPTMTATSAASNGNSHQCCAGHPNADTAPCQSGDGHEQRAQFAARSGHRLWCDPHIARRYNLDG